MFIKISYVDKAIKISFKYYIYRGKQKQKKYVQFS